jgi:hypothetical protein
LLLTAPKRVITSHLIGDVIHVDEEVESLLTATRFERNTVRQVDGKGGSELCGSFEICCGASEWSLKETFPHCVCDYRRTAQPGSAGPCEIIAANKAGVVG